MYIFGKQLTTKLRTYFQLNNWLKQLPFRENERLIQGIMLVFRDDKYMHICDKFTLNEINNSLQILINAFTFLANPYDFIITLFDVKCQIWFKSFSNNYTKYYGKFVKNIFLLLPHKRL